jgi:hypothetical protein
MFINLETVKKIASGTAISGGCPPGQPAVWQRAAYRVNNTNSMLINMSGVSTRAANPLARVTNQEEVC